jgi:glutathione S-transferase
MLLIQANIPFEFKIWNFLDDPKSAEALAKTSPINKVPILEISDSQKIFDSRVIANYLIKTHGFAIPSLEEENLISAVYSCLDASVTLFLMKANGYDIQAENFYLNRQRQRLPNNLEFIRPWAMELSPENPTDWNYASMSLYSFLYWADRRAGTIRLTEHKHWQKFINDFSGAPGVKETSF